MSMTPAKARTARALTRTQRNLLSALVKRDLPACIFSNQTTTVFRRMAERGWVSSRGLGVNRRYVITPAGRAALSALPPPATEVQK